MQNYFNSSISNEKFQKKFNKKLKHILSLYNTKKKYIDKRQSIRAKILLESQIKEENNRFQKETEKDRKEILDNNLENIQKKMLQLKKCVKKFTQIDEYLQKESYKYKKWDQLMADFDFETFLFENCQYIQKKNSLKEKTVQTTTLINFIKNENQRIRMNKFEFNNPNILRKTKSENNIHIRLTNYKKEKEFLTLTQKLITEKKKMHTLLKFPLENLETTNNSYFNERKFNDKNDELYPKDTAENKYKVTVVDEFNNISRIDECDKKNYNVSFINVSCFDN